MGARISGLGTPTLQIRGVRQLGGTTYRMIPDRIEISTLLLAAAITRGSATVTGAVPAHLESVLRRVAAAGATIEVDGDRIARRRPAGRSAAGGHLRRALPGRSHRRAGPVDGADEPGPGLRTVADRVFPGRFLHVAELSRLGADIERRRRRGDRPRRARG